VEEDVIREYKKQNRRKTKILIIDDESDNALLFRNTLVKKGFEEVDTANDPILALKNFKQGWYDLLIINVVMQQIDGFRLFEEIRKKDSKVKVCFITIGKVNYQAMRDVFPDATPTGDIGCFICKHVNMDDLARHVKRELDRDYG
ncbi:MAG TPA: response regulator, partial [Candidatus Bathyarchaeia archaeon]|nr:response regulator [Candidatus Bathyarchaeia archaeon]